MRAYISLLGCLLFSFVFTSSCFATISFTIDSPSISSNEITLNASISALPSTSCDSSGHCYLQGTIRQVGSIKYFGAIENHSGQWIEYLSSPSVEFIQSNFYKFKPESGNWSGIVKLRYFVENDNYKGPGQYEIKLRRFSGKSTGPAGDSNIIVVRLDDVVPTPTQIITPEATSVSTPTSSILVSETISPPKIKNDISQIVTKKISPTSTSTPTTTITATPSVETQVPSIVLGQEDSEEIPVEIDQSSESDQRANNQMLLPLIAVIILGTAIVFRFTKIIKNKH